MKRTAFQYYFRSAFTLLKGVRNPFIPLWLFFRRSNQPVRVDLSNGLSFYVLNFLDLWVLKETILDRDYERVGVPLQPGWQVIDIGAALGDYTVWAARQLTSGRLIAVEPYPPALSLMRINLEMNKINNVDIFAGAVAAKNGSASLNVSRDGVAMNSTAANQSTQSQVNVETISLDELMIKFKFTHCDYLKMDCEGGEYEILFNTPMATLSRIDRICMEIHDGLTHYDHTDMLHFLEQNGFKTSFTPNPVYDHIAFIFAERRQFLS